MQDNKAEQDDTGSSSTSISSQGSRISVGGRCCSESTATTSSTTTNTSSSNLDEVESTGVAQVDAKQSPGPEELCELMHNLEYATSKSNVLYTGTEQQVQCDTSAYVADRFSNQPGLSSVSMPSCSRVCKHVTVDPGDPPKYASSQSQSRIPDRNNNKDGASSRTPELQAMRKSKFSKSASGSRLVQGDDRHQRSLGPKSSTSSHVCDCLSQNCRERHSNRRHFIENYYNSRTRLPSSSPNAISSLNINTPLNRLSECDAITKRLLSSPIRGFSNMNQSPERRAHVSELDKSRRASLGTNTLTDQVSMFATSNQCTSLEADYVSRHASGTAYALKTFNIDQNRTVSPTSDSEIRSKHNQGRSLSVCHEEAQKSRFSDSGSSKNTSYNNHRPQQYLSSNLNRAVSLACDSISSKRLLTIIPLFGCDILDLEQFMKFGLILPPAIDSAVEHILTTGVKSVGIFRKSGVKSRILTLKQRIESNQDVEMDVLNRENEFSIYDIADLVKMWFRELKPTPILTKDLISIITDYLQRTGQRNEYSSQNQTAEVNDDLRRIFSDISPIHRALFSKTLSFFSTIASESGINQMTSQNLSICLTPSLCATESDQNSVVVAQRALRYCLDNYGSLF